MSSMEKQFFPQGKDRKELLEKNSEAIQQYKKEEILNLKKQPGLLNFFRKTPHYRDTNSPLENGNSNYSLFFEAVLPEGQKNLRSYIESSLAEKKGAALGVEFGGIGSNLFRGFSKGFFKESVGVTLVDTRTNKEKTRDGHENLEHNLHHTVLEGDILSEDVYKNLENTLAHRKVDLIIERMYLGLEFMPAEPYKLSEALKKWYKLLDEGGILLVQTPVVFNNLLDRWAEMIRKNHGQEIEFQYVEGSHDASLEDTGYSSFRLRKLKGAPEELPLLDSRTVAMIPKWISNEKVDKKNWYLDSK